MPSDRGAANLTRFNAQRSAHMIPLLTHELRLCSKRKQEFKSVGLLAAFLSDRMKVHRTTLLRNAKYKGMLLNHLAGQPGVVSRTPDSTSDPAILQAKLAAVKLAASNLGKELALCKAQIERLATGSRANPACDAGDVSYADLAMVMINLLHRFPDFLQLDRKRLELVDLSAKPSARIIAGKERIGQFVRWLEMNQALPIVQALVLGGSGSNSSGPGSSNGRSG